MAGLFGQDPELDEAAIAAGVFVRVAVERGMDQRIDDGLTYLAQPGGDPIAVGERVEVPLGRRNARTAGIVVRVGGRELLEDLPASKVKSVLRRTGSRLPEPLIELARWMAEYYVAPLGMVLATMIPAAVKQAVGRVRRIEIERTVPEAAATLIAARPLPPTAAAAWEAIALLPDDAFPVDPEALVARLGLPNLGPVNRLVRLGLLKRTERSDIRTGRPVWEHTRVQSAASVIVPTPAQNAVINGVCDSRGAFRGHLLRGVTGSGKTEVYLQVIDRVLRQGKSALVLVPEISLTPQTATRFIDRFGDAERRGVAVLHSGFAASQRHRQWALASSGAAPVVVGARSAVFAPLQRLGLIVVDEEHDGGYKQDQVPRYNARDVAIKRAQIESCPVVLASATPSLESWANADGGSSARFALWELDDRVGGGRLPDVQIIDLAEERKTAQRQTGLSPFHVIGPRLDAAIAQTLRADGQVILLLNRRGYANYICCPDANCGWVLHCDDCDAAMVLHRSGGGGVPVGGLLRCHHCLSERLVPRDCPVCGKRTTDLGAGTQRLEEELAERLSRLGLDPRKAMRRLDSDTMKTGRDYFEALSRFGAGEIRLLLGTQMIAKGLDFPNVRLVGVVNADTALSIPDFRAAERTFQLVSQVAGRTGRGAHLGRVLVQTMNPGEPAITLAARHDYVGFAKAELALRRAAGLPPATRMARIVVRDEDLEKAKASAEQLTAALTDAAQEDGGRVQVMGPMPCPLARIAGQYRFSIEMVAPTASDLHRPLSRLRARGLLTSDAATAVDVDPIALM